MTAHDGAVLDGIELFAGLAPDARARLAATATVTAVPAGTWLFREGERGDRLFVVRAGRIGLVLEHPVERVVRVLGAGSVVGELAVLADQPRSASARALRDSVVIEIERAALGALLDDEPGFGTAVVRLLAAKLAASSDLVVPVPEPATVVGLTAVEPLLLPPLREAVAAAMAAAGSVSTLDAATVAGAPAPAAALDRAQATSDRVLLAADGDSGWQQFCITQADRALVAVTGHPRRDPLPAELLGRDLLVVDPEPRAVAAWLRAARPQAHHLAHSGPELAAGVARAVRRVTGRSLGLVLSGGGARGLAHVGVAQVLADAGITIDRVGGCSMGALVGALVASERDARVMERSLRAELVDRHPFRDYTLPRASLIRANKARAMLERLFGDARIEDLALPYFCIGADLLSAEVVVHRDGALTTAVGASMSLPGIAPPVVSDGRLEVDGGVLDNLPIDVMDDGEGWIVAVDVMGRPRRSTPSGRPTFLETLARAATLGSTRWVDSNRHRASVVVMPEVADIGLMDFARFDQAVTAGRHAARRALDDIRALVDQPAGGAPSSRSSS